MDVPGLSYEVNVWSALAFDKETTMHTQVHTSTTGGQVYTVGNQVYSTPAQSTTGSQADNRRGPVGSVGRGGSDERRWGVSCMSYM